MNLIKQIFVYGEYSFLNQTNYYDANDRVTITRLPLGLGITQRIGTRSSFNMIAAYDMLHDSNFLYHPSPWVISFYFSI